MEDQIDYTNLEFKEKLGEGGGGTVNRVIFKKRFKGYREAAAKSVWELPKDEVEIMCKLQHPNIVHLLGFYQNGPVNILLLEYAPNGSLHDYLSDLTKPLSDPLICKWLGEAADAIEYLHGKNVLHRDIKAQNCLLFEDDVLKLCDFGIAREMDHSHTTSEQKGTYRYMAPELHRGNEEGRAIYSKPSDIYGYGMLILEIVTRKPPFDGMEWQTVVFSVCKGGRPEIPPECPQHLSQLIQRCWVDDPKSRPMIEDIKTDLLDTPSMWQGARADARPQHALYMERRPIHRLELAPSPVSQQPGPSLSKFSNPMSHNSEHAAPNRMRRNPIPGRSISTNQASSAPQGKPTSILGYPRIQNRKQASIKPITGHPLFTQRTPHAESQGLPTTTGYRKESVAITIPFFIAYKVQCCPNGNMVVSGDERNQLHMINSDGQHVKQLTSNEKADVVDIAVSPQGYIVVIFKSGSSVHVFNLQGRYRHCFPVLPDSSETLHLHCVGIDRDGNILVGNTRRETITIHTCPDGTLVKKLRFLHLTYDPASMTVNSRNQILFTTSRGNEVDIIDNSGNAISTFTPKIDEMSHHDTVQGMVCDSQDLIYVVMCSHRGKIPVPNTGHLHQYSPTGDFMRCIDKGIKRPLDLAIASDGALVIANEDKILIYRRN